MAMKIICKTKSPSVIFDRSADQMFDLELFGIFSESLDGGLKKIKIYMFLPYYSFIVSANVSYITS